MQHASRTQNITRFIALQWGVKAAQAGLPLSSNPYRSPETRSAWEQGYRQIAAADACPA